MAVRGRYSLLAAVFGLAMVVLASVAGLIASSRSRASDDEVRVGVSVEQALQLGAAYDDMEAGRRGYVIAGSEVFLEPYRLGSRNVDRLQRALSTNTANLGPEIGSPLRVVLAEGAAWQARAASELEARRGHVGGAAVAVTPADRQRFDELRDGIRRLAATLTDVQQRAFRLRERRAGQLVGLILAMPAAALSFLVIAMLTLRRWVVKPMQDIVAAVQQATASDLSVVVPAVGAPEVAALGLSVDRMRQTASQRLAAAERARTDAEEARLAIEQNTIAALQLRRELASELGLLPHGWTAAADVLPADGWAAGDCYDVTLVSPHVLGMMVLDIAGHGAAQAVVALKCKEILRAALRMRLSPGDAMQLLAEQIGELRGSFLTAFVALIDTDDGSCQYANAGHPPALLVGDEGEVRELGPTGPLLGAFPSTWSTVRAHLGPGARLAMYTDGLSEARDAAGRFFGTAELAANLVERRGEQAEPVLKASLTRCGRSGPSAWPMTSRWWSCAAPVLRTATSRSRADASRTRACTVVSVRSCRGRRSCTNSSGISPADVITCRRHRFMTRAPVDDLLLHFPSDDAEAAGLRARMRGWMSSAGVPGDAADDALLVASELFSNAVRASAGAEGVDVRVHVDAGGLLIEVANVGVGFDPDGVAASLPHRPGGRGIAIARTLGRLSIDQLDGRTSVRVTLMAPVIT